VGQEPLSRVDKHSGPKDILQAAPPAAPEPWYPPPQAPVPPRTGISVNAVISLVGLFLGVLIFTGLLTFHAVFLIPLPPPFQSPTDPDVIAYRDTVRTLGWVSIIAMDLAVALTVMTAWLVGGLKADLSEATRRGIFTFATVFLVVWLAFSFFAYAIFRSFIPFG
jgi:hypothetical protein